MAMPEVSLRQFPTFGTSTQASKPDGTEPADRFRLRNISSLTASGLPKPAADIAQSVCAHNARVATEHENPKDPARYAHGGNIT